MTVSREFLCTKTQKCVWETLNLLLWVNHRDGRQEWEIMQGRNGARAINIKLMTLGYFPPKTQKDIAVVIIFNFVL